MGMFTSNCVALRCVGQHKEGNGAIPFVTESTSKCHLNICGRKTARCRRIWCASAVDNSLKAVKATTQQIKVAVIARTANLLQAIQQCAYPLYNA